MQIIESPMTLDASAFKLGVALHCDFWLDQNCEEEIDLERSKI